MPSAQVGVIGGSGLYRLVGAECEEVQIETPFGEPSGPFRLANIGGREVAFLARHGDGHRLTPTEVPYRANIWAMKSLGVEAIVSLSACGSLKEELGPRHFVLVDQFIDRTRLRASTFFGEGLVAHVSLAEPTCRDLRVAAARSARAGDIPCSPSGTYVCMEGPQFSTRAESHLYRSWGADVIGMTNSTEARLAREAEICYLSVSMVTDHDCWKVEEEPVTVEVLLGHLQANAQAGEWLLCNLLESWPEEYTCDCRSALKSALITPAEAVPPATRAKLELLVGKYFEEKD